MYENTTILSIVPGKLEEVIALFRAVLLPLFVGNPGLMSLCLIPHWQDNRLVVLSIWTEEKHAREVETSLAFYKGMRQLDGYCCDQAPKLVNVRRGCQSMIEADPAIRN